MVFFETRLLGILEAREKDPGKVGFLQAHVLVKDPDTGRLCNPEMAIENRG
jgi:hypothetical protein